MKAFVQILSVSLYVAGASIIWNAAANADGNFTTILGTSPVAINLREDITGTYTDKIGEHGFLRSRDGAFTAFDAPGASDTVPRAIDPDGVITGSYDDQSGTTRGFTRAGDGTFTTFDVPGHSETYPAAINAGGVVTGTYCDPYPSGCGGFVRTK